MLCSTVQAFKQAKKLKADYYHIHDPELLPVAWLLKNKKNVVIYDIHEDYVTSILQKDYLSKPVKKIVASIYKILEDLLTSRLELVLAEKYYKDHYPNGKCILNYPILNKRVMENKKNDRAQDKNQVIYTGNVTEDRGALIHSRLPLLDEQLYVNLVGRCSSKLANQMLEIAGDGRTV